MKNLLLRPLTWGLVLVVVLSVSCGDPGSSVSNSGAGGESGDFPDSSGPFRTEEEFIIHGVVSRIAQVVNTIRLSEDNYQKIDSVRVSPVNVDDPSDGYEVVVARSGKEMPPVGLGSWKFIWDPSGYQPVVAGMLNEAIAAPDAGDAGSLTDEALLSMLLLYSDSAVNRASQMVTTQLESAPAGVQTHEQAALVAAVHAMREMAGMYSDNRHGLNLACAHLAVAQHLRGEAHIGPSARLASIIIKATCGRSVDARDELNAWEAAAETEPSQALAIWRKALRARIIHDWRPLEPDAQMTTLERMMGYREHCAMVSPNLAEARYGEEKLFQHTDYARGGYSYGYSVEMGNGLIEYGLQNELLQVKEIFGGTTLEEAVAKLSEYPMKSDSASDPLVVIPESMWAYYFQRHIVLMATGGSQHLRNKLGISEMAQEFDDNMLEAFNDLQLFALAIHILRAPDNEEYDARSRLSSIMTRTPQYIPVPRWIYTYFKVKDNYLINPVTFTGSNPPYGTTDNFSFRFRYIKEATDMREEAVTHALELDPYDVYLCQDYMNTIHRGKPDISVIEKLAAPMLDYSVHALEWLTSHYKSDPLKYIPYMERICELNPNQLLPFGNYLIQNDEPVMAEKVFESAMLQANDTVTLANNLQWLADRYMDSGRKEAALRVAAIGMDAYSARGLNTYIKVMSHYGYWDEAREAAEGMHDRYGRPDQLMLFYMKAAKATGRQEFKDIFQKYENQLFPDGQRKVTLADFSGPPTFGTVYTQDSALLTEAGLGRGAIAVAIHGVEVRNHYQYMFISNVVEDPELDLIVYYQDEYRQIKASPPGKLFGVSLGTFGN